MFNMDTEAKPQPGSEDGSSPLSFKVHSIRATGETSMLLRFLLVSVVTSLGMDAPTPTQMDCWTCQARTWWDAQAECSAVPNEVAPPAVVAELPEPAAANPVEVVATVTEATLAPMPDDSAAFAAEAVVETTNAVAEVPAEVLSPMPDDVSAFLTGLFEPVPAEVTPTTEAALAPMPDDAAAFAGTPVDAMPGGLEAFVSDPETAQPAELVETAANPADLEAFFAELAADPVSVLYPALEHELVAGEPTEAVVETESRIEILDDQPATAEAVPAAPIKDGKLSEAVRLTRQAVRAWVGVLNAPAVVSARR
jgi:hypothetical protein